MNVKDTLERLEDRVNRGVQPCDRCQKRPAIFARLYLGKPPEAVCADKFCIGAEQPEVYWKQVQLTRARGL
jgi:hypothetical protein